MIQVILGRFFHLGQEVATVDFIAKQVTAFIVTRAAWKLRVINCCLEHLQELVLYPRHQIVAADSSFLNFKY